MKKKTTEQPKNSKKKRKVFLILLGLFILAGIVLQIKNFDRRTEIANSTSSEEMEAIESDEEANPDISVTYKDENEMNQQYGSYLTEHPIDFFAGQTKIKLTSFYESPELIFQNNKDNSKYFSISFGGDSYEEYITDTEVYRHTISNSEELWGRSEAGDNNEAFHELFGETINSIYLDNVCLHVQCIFERRFYKEYWCKHTSIKAGLYYNDLIDMWYNALDRLWENADGYYSIYFPPTIDRYEEELNQREQEILLELKLA